MKKNPELIRLGWELVQLVEKFKVELMKDIDVESLEPSMALVKEIIEQEAAKRGYTCEFIPGPYSTRPSAPQATTSTGAGVDNALELTCRQICDTTGTCPHDQFDWQGCEAVKGTGDECPPLGDTYKCWVNYYLAQGEATP